MKNIKGIGIQKQQLSKVKSWSKVYTLKQALSLLEQGILLDWEAMEKLKIKMCKKDEEELVKNFATLLLLRYKERFSCEILVETMLIWFCFKNEDKQLAIFFQTLLEDPKGFQAAKALTKLSLTSEFVESKHQNSLLATSTGIICELGIAINQYRAVFPEETEETKETLDYIDSYLSSTSNINNPENRLVLIHYFGFQSYYNNRTEILSKMILRFGQNIFDQLFKALIKKETESACFIFLKKNLSYILAGDEKSQEILYNSLKTYLLKNPDHFSIFISDFTSYLKSKDEEKIKKSQQRLLIYLLRFLFKSMSMKKKKVQQEILNSLAVLCKNASFLQKDLKAHLKKIEFSPVIQDILDKIIKEESSIEIAIQIKSIFPRLRGRHPHMHMKKIKNQGILQQILLINGIKKDNKLNKNKIKMRKAA